LIPNHNMSYSTVKFRFHISSEHMVKSRKYSFEVNVNDSEFIRMKIFNAQGLECFSFDREKLKPLLTSSGSLILKVNVKIITTEPVVRQTKFFSRADAKNKILLSFVSLHDDKEFADFTFVVKGNKFKVHKAILAARSEVFRKMFSTDMKEARNNECKIDNIEPEIFETLLRFIYTAETSENMKDIAIKLFETAHYYCIEELKSICEQEIQANVKQENALDTYKFVCVYGGEKLKLDAWQIIKR
jgi:hypothetical protein